MSINVDGLSHIAGLGPLVTLGGRQWLVKGRQLKYYAMMEAEIIRKRGNPFEMIVMAAKEMRDDARVVDVVAIAVSERFRNWKFANYQDYAAFNSTPFGEAFQIWCAISHQDKDLTIEQVQFWMMELLQHEGMEGLKKKDAILEAIEQASSEDQLGNSGGPQQTTSPMTAA